MLQWGVCEMNPLLDSVRMGVVSAVIEMTSSRETLCMRDENGFSLLHNASLYGHASIVSVLLDLGVDINEKTPLGNTALHLAANDDVVRCLLARGADLWLANDDGRFAQQDNPVVHRVVAAQPQQFVVDGCEPTRAISTSSKTNSKPEIKTRWVNGVSPFASEKFQGV